MKPQRPLRQDLLNAENTEVYAEFAEDNRFQTEMARYKITPLPTFSDSLASFLKRLKQVKQCIQAE